MLRAGLWHRGAVKLVAVDAPQAGKDWKQRVPDVPEGVLWELKTAVFTFVASGAAANRNIRLIVDNGTDGGVIAFDLTTQNVTAGQTVIVQAGETHGGNTLQAGPPIRLTLGNHPFEQRYPSGCRVGTETALMDAGDQYSGIVLLIQEWIYEPAGERTPNAGDGSGRVDTIALQELNGTLQKLAKLFESQQATP